MCYTNIGLNLNIQLFYEMLKINVLIHSGFSPYEMYIIEENIQCR